MWYAKCHKVGIVGDGTTTDGHGHFRLDPGPLPADIIVSYIGYSQTTVKVKDDNQHLVVRLHEDNHHLDEVVVVGYGTQRRRQLTGSVVTVKSDVFENSTAATLDGALSGQVAGLSVTAASGQPGAESSIRIRGGNSVNASGRASLCGRWLHLFQGRLHQWHCVGCYRVLP